MKTESRAATGWWARLIEEVRGYLRREAARRAAGIPVGAYMVLELGEPGEEEPGVGGDSEPLKA